ncbi:hypothetical protein ACTFIR_012863 [Dictyostelium discoideum]
MRLTSDRGSGDRITFGKFSKKIKNGKSFDDISRLIVPEIKNYKEEVEVLGPDFMIVNAHGGISEKRFLENKKKLLEQKIASLTAELKEVDQPINNLPNK